MKAIIKSWKKKVPISIEHTTTHQTKQQIFRPFFKTTTSKELEKKKKQKIVSYLDSSMIVRFPFDTLVDWNRIIQFSNLRQFR